MKPHSAYELGKDFLLQEIASRTQSEFLTQKFVANPNMVSSTEDGWPLCARIYLCIFVYDFVSSVTFAMALVSSDPPSL